MTFYEAAALAKQANPKQMWLTHYSPSLTKPGGVYGGSQNDFPKGQKLPGTDGQRSWNSMRTDRTVRGTGRIRGSGENIMIGQASEDVLILAIESSCDETAAAVVKNGRTVLSNVISSQIATHTVYGGVVPEIASREHIKAVNYVIERALAEAQVTLQDITAIGVTYGPGLVGALLGVWQRQRPLHMQQESL